MLTFNRLLIGAVLGGMVASGVALATPATVTGQAHSAAAPADAAVVAELVRASWPTGPFRDDNVGCWVEHVHSATTAEVICGDQGDRPRTGTVDIGEVFAVGTADGQDPCGYVASWAWRQGFDVAPAGCN